MVQWFVRRWEKLAKNFSNAKGKKEGGKREIFFPGLYFKGDRVLSMGKKYALKIQ